jgi:hypothetical protein
MGNFQITGEPLTERLDRMWCTRTAVADKIAAVAGRVAGIPRQAGRMTVRKSSLGTLLPGQRFLFTWPPLGITNLVCRVTALTVNSPAEPSAQLSWEVDRGELNTDDYLPEIDPPPDVPVFDPALNDFEQILEAPAGLPPDEFPGDRLIVLAARGNLITTGFNIWHRRPSTTFVYEDAAQSFAVHGELDEEYTADTTVIDESVGLLLTLDSADLEFDNRELADALTNDVLLFVGNEILAPFNAELVTGNQWRIYAIRARYDTEKLTHANGSGVWIMDRLPGVYHPAHPEEAEQTYKLQPYSINRDVEIGDVTPVSVTTNHRGRRPLRPLNLAEGGHLFAPTFSTGEDLELTWQQTMEVRPNLWSLWGGGITANLPKTVLEFRDTSDDLKRTVTLDPGVEAYTYDNAELVADFGGEETVVVRAYQQRDSFRSLLYSEITIELI